MFLVILQVLQVISAAILILLVLIHSPKGDGLGAIGGAAQMFSSQRGAEEGLNKTTAIVATAFFVLSAIVGYYGKYFIGS